MHKRSDRSKNDYLYRTPHHVRFNKKNFHFLNGPTEFQRGLCYWMAITFKTTIDDRRLCHSVHGTFGCTRRRSLLDNNSFPDIIVGNRKRKFANAKFYYENRVIDERWENMIFENFKLVNWKTLICATLYTRTYKEYKTESEETAEKKYNDISTPGPGGMSIHTLIYRHV